MRIITKENCSIEQLPIASPTMKYRVICFASIPVVGQKQLQKVGIQKHIEIEHKFLIEQKPFEERYEEELEKAIQWMNEYFINSLGEGEIIIKGFAGDEKLGMSPIPDRKLIIDQDRLEEITISDRI